MEHRVKHAPRFVFRVGDARAGPSEEKGVYDRPKVLVLRKASAICDTARHRVVKGAAIEFRGAKERVFYACLIVGEIAQWLINLSWRPCEFRDLAHGW